MSSPVQTPTVKAASLIKRFQTTIDGNDVNPSPTRDPHLVAHRRTSISSANPVQSPLLNSIKHNRPIATKATPSPRSRATDSTLRQDPKTPLQTHDPTPNTTTPKTSHNSPLTSRLKEVDQNVELPQEQAPAKHDPPMAQSSDLAKPPLSDQPSHPSKPASISPVPDALSTSPTDPPPMIPVEPVGDQTVPPSNQPLTKQPSNAMKKSLSEASKPSDRASARPPIHNPKVTKPLTTRAPPATSTRAKVKPSIPPNTRESLSTRKHVSVSAATVALRAGATSNSRQPISSQRNPNLTQSTAAPRVKTRDSLAAAASTSQPRTSDSTTTPVKARRQSVGAATLPKNTSTLRTITKMSVSPSLAKVEESAAASSVIRKARTSLRPLKESTKVAPARPAQPAQPAITQATRKTVTVETKSTPLTSADVIAAPSKKPILSASTKSARRISMTDSSKTAKVEPKSHPVTATASVPSKKTDLKPIPRARVSVVPSAADNKKPTATKATSQSTTTSSKLKSTAPKKTLDLKVVNSPSRSTFSRAAPNTTKAVKSSSVPASDALSTQLGNKTITTSEALPSTASSTKVLAPQATNQGGIQTQSEHPSHPEPEVHEEPENSVDQSVDHIQVEQRPTPAEPEGSSLVGPSELEDHDSQHEDRHRPASAVKELLSGNVDKDDTQTQSVSESGSVTQPPIVDETQVATSDEQQDAINDPVDQNQAEKETIPVQSQVSGEDGESQLNAKENHTTPTEEELPSDSTSEHVIHENQSVSESPLPSVPRLEEQEPTTKPAELQHTVNPIQEEENTVSEDPKVDNLAIEPKSDSQSQPGNQSSSATIDRESSKEDRNQIKPESQLEGQEKVVNLVIDETQDEKRNAPGELDSLFGESKIEPPSQFVVDDQPILTSKELTSENTNEVKNEAEAVGEPDPLIDPAAENVGGTVSENLVKSTNQPDDQDQVGKETFSPSSEAANVADEPTFKTHSQHEDEDAVPVPEKQIGTIQSLDGDAAKTETIPKDPEENKFSAEVAAVPVYSVDICSSASEPAGQVPKARLLENQDHEKDQISATSETSSKDCGSTGPRDDCLDQRDEVIEEHETHADPLPIEQRVGQSHHGIPMEKGTISPKSVATEMVNELMPEPHGQLDNKNHLTKSEGSETKAQPIHLQVQAENNIVPTNIQGYESSQQPLIVDEDQVVKPEAIQIPAHPLDTGKEAVEELHPMYSKPIESVEAAQLEKGSEPADEDQIVRSGTPESEASHFVYYNREPLTSSVACPEFEDTFIDEATREPDASQFVKDQNQQQQETPTANPESECSSIVEVTEEVDPNQFVYPTEKEDQVTTLVHPQSERTCLEAPREPEASQVVRLNNEEQEMKPFNPESERTSIVHQVPQSEANQHVDCDKEEEEETNYVGDDQLEQPSVAGATPEPGARQFDNNNNGEEQESITDNREPERTSFAQETPESKAPPNRTESPKLPLLPSFNPSESISKYEDEYRPLTFAETEVPHQNKHQYERRIESADQSESMVYQFEEQNESSRSADQENEAEQFNYPTREKKESVSPYRAAGDSLDKSKSNYQFGLGLPDQNSDSGVKDSGVDHTLDEIEVESNSGESQVVGLVGAPKLGVDKDQDPRPEGKQNPYHQFGIQPEEETY